MIQQIGWAFVRIFEHLKASCTATAGPVPLPFRQQDLADALGLSLVHTNKTLKILFSRKLIRWKGGMLEILDAARLMETGKVEALLPPLRPLI